jgi:hypothetical protein
MLTRTFVHIPKVGYVTERRLWEAGVDGWDHAEAVDEAPGGFTARRWRLVQDTLADSRRSLDAGDHRHFAQRLHPRDHWRAFPQFQHRVGYLDIETDGMTAWNVVTVIGLYDGRRCRSYVLGENMAQFADDIRDYSLLVTFNGASFDLPFLRRRFGDLFDHLHVDLRFALGRLGFNGGLKSIERQLGMRREDEIADLSGEDAVWLWREYKRGSAEALELLLAYNRADVENLAQLMDLAYRALWQRALDASTDDTTS